MSKNFKKVEDVLYRKIFNYAKGGISIVSLNGAWVKVNHSLSKLLGYSEEEFYSMAFQDITHKDDLEKDINLMHQLLNGDIENYQMEKRLRYLKTSNGTYRVYLDCFGQFYLPMVTMRLLR